MKNLIILCLFLLLCTAIAEAQSTLFRDKDGKGYYYEYIINQGDNYSLGFKEGDSFIENKYPKPYLLKIEVYKDELHVFTQSHRESVGSSQTYQFDRIVDKLPLMDNSIYHAVYTQKLVNPHEDSSKIFVKEAVINIQKSHNTKLIYLKTDELELTYYQK